MHVVFGFKIHDYLNLGLDIVLIFIPLFSTFVHFNICNF